MGQEITVNPVTGRFDLISVEAVPSETDPLSLHLDQTTPQVITAADATITASDEVYYGDVTDSKKIKKDTVQGILDLVPATTSIKKTRTFGRTWTTGDSVFIKTKMVFLANEKFVRVYKDNVLLTYSTDWEFNSNDGFKIGVVSDLVDGVKLISPTNGSVYRVEFDEYLIPFSPMLGLFRTDGKMSNKGLPRNTVVDDSRSGIISNSSLDEETKDYTITYKKPDTSTFTLTRRYPDRAFCLDYDFDVALPTNWRIEIYKIGRNWSGTRASASGSWLETMNSVMVPRAITTTNNFSINFLFDKKRIGAIKIKCRNTVTNEVSLFSIQTICARSFKYVDRTFTPFGVRYKKATLK